MTDTYIRKSTTVQAYLFGGQPQAQWPEWLREHKIATNMGIVPPALAHGVLLIPQPHGSTINVAPGNYVVLERGVLSKYKPDEFDVLFAGVESEAASEDADAPAAEPVPVEAAPAEATPVEPTAEKPARGKKETPATEDAASE